MAQTPAMSAINYYREITDDEVELLESIPADHYFRIPNGHDEILRICFWNPDIFSVVNDTVRRQDWNGAVRGIRSLPQDHTDLEIFEALKDAINEFSGIEQLPHKQKPDPFREPRSRADLCAQADLVLQNSADFNEVETLLCKAILFNRRIRAHGIEERDIVEANAVLSDYLLERIGRRGNVPQKESPEAIGVVYRAGNAEAAKLIQEVYSAWSVSYPAQILIGYPSYDAVAGNWVLPMEAELHASRAISFEEAWELHVPEEHREYAEDIYEGNILLHQAIPEESEIDGTAFFLDAPSMRYGIFFIQLPFDLDYVLDIEDFSRDAKWPLILGRQPTDYERKVYDLAIKEVIELALGDWSPEGDTP